MAWGVVIPTHRHKMKKGDHGRRIREAPYYVSKTMMCKELSVYRSAYISDMLTVVWNETVTRLARATSFIIDERNVDGADGIQRLISGRLPRPDRSRKGLCQVFRYRDVERRAPGQCHRLISAAVEEAVPTHWLPRCEAVLLEDRSTSGVLKELAGIWQGHARTSHYALKKTKHVTRALIWEMSRSTSREESGTMRVSCAQCAPPDL
jgi:hypothetical protein